MGVADPNAFVLKAAGKTESSEPAMQSLSEVDVALRRRIGWLNNNIKFEMPLMYCKVAPELSGIGLPAAYAILKKLEVEAAESLAGIGPDPTEWVLAAVRDSRAP